MDNTQTDKKQKPELKDNPFEDPEVARIWIESVENEKGLFRDKFIYPLIKKWLSQDKLKRILDVGAGQGIATTLAEDKEYIGLEPSEELLKRAVEKYGDLGKFIKGSIYELPFPNESFNGVFAVNVWFHLQDIQRASRELARVLVKNGQGLITNPNPDQYTLWKSFYENVKEFEGGFEGSVYIPGGILPRNIFYTHSQEDILNAFKQARLTIVETASLCTIESGKNLFSYYIILKNMF